MDDDSRMTTSDPIKIDLGESVRAQCIERVEANAKYGAPLQGRLSLARSIEPYAFLSTALSAEAASDLSVGGVGSDAASDWLATSIAGWIGGPAAADRGRLLIFEDMHAKKSDPSEPLRLDRHFGEWVYPTAPLDATAAEVEEAIAGVAGFANVGVLTEPSLRTCGTVDFKAHDLDDIANSTVAVLLQAWDDEAFIVLQLAPDFRL